MGVNLYEEFELRNADLKMQMICGKVFYFELYEKLVHTTKGSFAVSEQIMVHLMMEQKRLLVFRVWNNILKSCFHTNVRFYV